MTRRGSTRERKIVWSVAGTMVGVLLLTVAAVWHGQQRDTDLANPEEGVTSREREVSASLPPITFVDVAAERGLAFRHGPGVRTRSLPEDTGSGVAWGDVDGDGDFDLYAVNFPGPWGGAVDPEGGNRLFRNDGVEADPSEPGANAVNFVDITAEAGVADLEGYGMGAYFADYDADGDVDLFVTNLGPNRLFRNRGDGTFDEVAAEAGVAGEENEWSTGATWGDVNRDGHLDLYVANYVDFNIGADEAASLPKSPMGEESVPFTLNPNSFDPQPNRLFLGRGDGTFEDVTEAYGVADPQGRGFAAALVDLDGDGWLDLYVNNDVSTNKLYRNAGGEGRAAFDDMSTYTGTADPRGSMGLSVADLGDADGGPPDGLPDLFITHWEAQENAFYFAMPGASGGTAWEYRDRTRDLKLGEISTDTVGWGSALLDMDLDGLLDLVVVNGSTLEDPKDSSRLQAEAPFLLWNDGTRFHAVLAEAGSGRDSAEAGPGRDSADAGPAPAGDGADPQATLAAPMNGRGLAAADYDGDGDVDLAVSVNRGSLRLLENRTPPAGGSLSVVLDAPDALSFGARVTVISAGSRQIRWWGADVGFLGNHAREMVFGLGEAVGADEVAVHWADGSLTTVRDVEPGRVEIRFERE